ncbi:MULTISPECIES: hypothetical protein [Alphaproteobacteria]|uniref:Uncharacterized protein n=2 Tax=Alphaproteobacteria TaxID=28211 RepID=A0A512HIN1_9HYPH|nr:MULTISPECIES: hypothetical protein [Alphaproteobacteria]GEO85313.1 hypothetical protein RNA01_22450 [Ciceribacter naphthalenivorans]GLR20952.1 hypothetical protein GCM10007920_07370 [Ciceribacter naphthalenivorans]GLT03808.1 hypothetical protein GCM10007926_07370 [Sphingomonas psychrolutea]
MLPPVNTAANSSASFQDPRAAQEGAVMANARPQGLVPQAANGLEQNAAIAGRLGILLLSGQERMSDNLAILVNLLGSRLGMERAEGESLSGYAGRLVQAIGDLSPQTRQSVQRQLAQMFGGLQLHTLIEAFRNPAGPEAATLAIYLELYRAKDKDLVARSVVTSYRQNAGDLRPASVLSSASPAMAGNGLGTSAARSPGPAPRAELAAPETQGALAAEADLRGDLPDDPFASVAKGRLLSSQDERSRKILKIAAARALQTTMSFSAAHPVQGEAIQDARAGSFVAREGFEPSQERLSKQDAAPPSQAPTAGKSEAPATRVPAPPSLPAKVSVEAAAIEADTGDEFQIPSVPSLVKVQNEVAPQAARTTQTLFVLKGWKEEVATDSGNPPPASATLEDLFPGPERLLRPSGLGPVEDEKGSGPPAAAADKQQALAERAPSSAEHENAVFDEAESSTLQAEGANDTRAEKANRLEDIPNLENTLQRQMPVSRDGVPLPLVNYLFAADEVVEEQELKHRFNEEQDGDGNSERQSGENADDQGERETPEPEETEALLGHDEDDITPGEARGEGETPNDLYWRMAGWA